MKTNNLYHLFYPEYIKIQLFRRDIWLQEIILTEDVIEILVLDAIMGTGSHLVGKTLKN